MSDCLPYGCEVESIAEWCRERGIEIVQCVIYSSEYFRTASARVTVEGKDADTVCHLAKHNGSYREGMAFQY